MVLVHSIVLSGFLVICQNVYAASGSEFCYKEDQDCSPTHWHGVCQTGKHQSPIDIELNVLRLLLPTLTDLDLSNCYSRNQDFILQNNGHTAQVELADQTSSCILAGDLVRNFHIFAQMHFHWSRTDQGSEHTLNHVKYAMEGHLVHYRSDFDNVTHAVASGAPDALVVLGVLFMLDVNDNDNPALEPIIRALGGVRSTGTQIQAPGLVLADFLNLSTRKSIPVVQYDGSLTTPDCNETVLWNVFTEPKYISRRQLDQFRSLLDASGEPLANNDRPIQPRYYRQIRYCLTSIEVPGR